MLFPFENVLSDLNESIQICFQNVIFVIYLVINPFCNDFSGAPSNDLNFFCSAQNIEDFINISKKLNEEMECKLDLLNFKTYTFKKKLNHDFYSKINELSKEENELIVNSCIHQTLTTNLLNYQIDVSWVNPEFQQQQENNLELENMLPTPDFDQTDTCSLQNESQNDFREVIINKSKSKQKMVLRERKKLSFIHFYMTRNYSPHENTHMKRYKKVLDKNNNNIDEICVICLGLLLFFFVVILYFR